MRSDNEQLPIGVEVETLYIDEQSDPDNHRYVFSYHITITNRLTEPVQLLSRYWCITDGDGGQQEVQGEGVVGAKPRIAPGDSYSYSSGTVIATEVGSMEGYYDMRTDDGSHFKAPIAPFTLAVPRALH
ncbi:MAG TPA: Co2+/Mg2+ efflux protein ApaG [Motiliproteus sp.]